MTDYNIALNYLSQHYPMLSQEDFAAAGDLSQICEEIWSTQQLAPRAGC